MITHACILNKSGSVSRVLRCDKTRQAFENTREICKKHEPQTSVFYISRVFSNARSVSSQYNTRIRLLHLLYDRFYARKTIKHAFSIFYTLIKNGFLTNQSARRVLATLWKVLKKGTDAGCGKKNIKKTNSTSSFTFQHATHSDKGLEHLHILQKYCNLDVKEYKR